MVQLEREMEALKRRAIDNQDRTTMSPPGAVPLQNLIHPDPRSLPSPTYFPQRRPLPPPPPPPVTQASQNLVRDWSCSPKTIEGFTLTIETIQNLFKEFVEKYHPFLPVVDISRGPEEIYRLCPPLFWTIMAIASRRYQQDGDLMMQLSPLVKTALAEIAISPITRYGTGEQTTVLNLASVYSVQAFLICTMWPHLTSTLSADSSWNSAGIAMFNSIRVGLHCPGYARDFARIKADNPIYPKVNEQIRTWICCNVVSQAIGGMFGFPSFTTFDATILAACRADSGMDVPETIRQMMMIQQLENEIEKALNSNLMDPSGLAELSERLSLIQIMAHKLDELELTITDLDDSRRLMLLATRVHLLTYYFLDSDGLTGVKLRIGLVQVYNSALALLDHCDQVCRRDKDFIRYVPQVYITIIWQTALIVNKVLHSQYAEYVDPNAGRVLYYATVQHLAKASILKHDMAYRAAEIMQQMWRLYDSLADKADMRTVQAKVSIRTRMAASVFFDSLWTMREECGIRSVAPAILNQRTTSSDGEPDVQHYENAVQPQSAPPQGPGQIAGVLPPFTEGLNVDPGTIPTPAESHSGVTNRFDWDVDLVWKDVDLMMNDFGFRVEEVSSMM
jgi:transcriptional regulatory protein LEU3